MVTTVLDATLGSRLTTQVSPNRNRTISIEYDVIDLAMVQQDALHPRRWLAPKAIAAAGRVLGNGVSTEGAETPIVLDERGHVSPAPGRDPARAVSFGHDLAIVGHTTIDGRFQACSWQGRVCTHLSIPDVLRDDVVDSFAGAASVDGAIAGWMTMTDGCAVPLRWFEDDVDVLPAAGAMTHGYPASILDDGSIAGEARGVDGGHYPIAWLGGSAALLDTPRRYGRVLAGSAAATAHLGSAWDGTRFAAAIWRNDACTLLPEGKAPYCESAALGLNDAGTAVGVIYRDIVRSAWVACRWQGDRVEALDDLIDPEPGIRLAAATSINGAGQIAAAAIWPDGSLHAVRLDPR